MKNLILISVYAGFLFACFMLFLGIVSIADGQYDNDCAKFALFCVGK